MDAGEEPIDAAKRELLEEAGATSEKWTSLGYSVSLPAMVNFSEHLFLAEEVVLVAEPSPGAGEVVEIIEMPLTEAVQKIMDGEIVHDSTIVAVMKAHTLLSNR